jgi:hypothetical protein
MCAKNDIQARKLKSHYDKLFTCRLEDQKSKRDLIKAEKERQRRLLEK